MCVCVVLHSSGPAPYLYGAYTQIVKAQFAYAPTNRGEQCSFHSNPVCIARIEPHCNGNMRAAGTVQFVVNLSGSLNVLVGPMNKLFCIVRHFAMRVPIVHTIDEYINAIESKRVFFSVKRRRIIHKPPHKHLQPE